MPQFKNCDVVDEYRTPSRFRIEEVNGIQYAVSVVKRLKVTPSKAGKLKMSKGKCKVMVDQSVYYDDIHEIHFDRKTGAITVVVFSTERLVMCSKMTRNKGKNDFNPSPYLRLLFSFTENQDEAYRILNEVSAPFIYKEK